MPESFAIIGNALLPWAIIALCAYVVVCRPEYAGQMSTLFISAGGVVGAHSFNNKKPTCPPTKKPKQ